LSEALAVLNRDPGFQRIVLRGLTRGEVSAYIRATANVTPKPEVIDRIFEETEGNPFFLSEVVNLLTQEGSLLKESVSDIAVPDGVREALGRRLDRLSEEANALLQVAAIVGREFAYDMLDLLGERSEDDLLKLIEEGIDARVIEELPQPGRYRFTHALMQETLLAELSTTRRVRLHGQVGEALEKRWGDRRPRRRACPPPRGALRRVVDTDAAPRPPRRPLREARRPAGGSADGLGRSGEVV
jgi:predicted ATPase